MVDSAKPRNLESLEALGRHFGVKVKACKHYNANVGDWAWHEIRFRLRGYRVAALLSVTRLDIGVRGFDTEVSCSFNAPDRICGLNKLLVDPPPSTPYPVYAASQGSPPLIGWLKKARSIGMLASLRLTEGESLQVYRNSVVLIGWLTRATPHTVDEVCGLADALRHQKVSDDVDGLAFCVENLPPGLRSLGPLIRRFAVSDDEIRDDILGQLTSAEREALRGAVEPHFSQINSFIDSFRGSPLPSEAILLGRLAEAAAEIAARGGQ